MAVMAAPGPLSELLVGSRVEVKCVDNVTRTGYFYTRDPLTNALVIVNRVKRCDKVDLDRNGSNISDDQLGPNGILECEKQNLCENMDNRQWSMQFEIIMGDAYIKIEQIDESTDSYDWAFLEKSISHKLDERKLVAAAQFGPEDLRSRMNTVAEFLSSHHLPVSIDKDVIVLFDGMTKIEPPYVSESCICRNPVVLDKIHKLLGQCSFKKAREANESE